MARVYELGDLGEKVPAVLYAARGGVLEEEAREGGEAGAEGEAGPDEEPGCHFRWGGFAYRSGSGFV